MTAKKIQRDGALMLSVSGSSFKVGVKNPEMSKTETGLTSADLT